MQYPRDTLYALIAFNGGIRQISYRDMACLIAYGMYNDVYSPSDKSTIHAEKLENFFSDPLLKDDLRLKPTEVSRYLHALANRNIIELREGGHKIYMDEEFSGMIRKYHDCVMSGINDNPSLFERSLLFADLFNFYVNNNRLPNFEELEKKCRGITSEAERYLLHEPMHDESISCML